MFFIIVAVASTLHMNGITHIETADQAAEALRPFAGDFAYLLFALGIIGTGLLAVPVLAGSAAYAVAEALSWNVGLGQKFNQARGFYGIIIGATLVGVLVNFLSIQPFQLLYYTAILNGIVAPPLIFLILKISNSKKIMGEHKNSWISNSLGSMIGVIMAVCAVVLLIMV